MPLKTDQDAWLQLLIESSPVTAEMLAESLTRAGAQAVSLEDSADDPVFEPPPGSAPLWPHTRVTALFPPDADVDGIMARVQRELGLPAPPVYRTERLQEQDWERAWMDRFHAMRFGGRLWVCPSATPPPDPGAVNIVLDPGLAFGTGTHATTALCLEWLDAHPPSGLEVIDYGCGSGILAIAAAKLGARRVWALDIDPQAVWASTENARKNAVADRVSALAPSELPPLQADCLLANILAGPLIELAPRFAALLQAGAGIALTGILQDQIDELAAAYRDHFDLDPPRLRDDWALLTGRKRSGAGHAPG